MDKTSVIAVNLESQFEPVSILDTKSIGLSRYLRHDAITDLDRFDCSSLHYAAMDDSQAVVGTVRLILPAARIMPIQRDLDRVEQWCSYMRYKYGIRSDQSNSLPVMGTLESTICRCHC